jgi:hypothetical protein
MAVGKNVLCFLNSSPLAHVDVPTRIRNAGEENADQQWADVIENGESEGSAATASASCY